MTVELSQSQPEFLLCSSKMCNTPLHANNFDNANDSFPSFPTLHLLRSCNRLMLPNSGIQSCYNFIKDHRNASPTMSFGNSFCNATARDCNEHRKTVKSPELNVIDAISLESNTKSSLLGNVADVDEDSALLSVLPIETEVPLSSGDPSALYRNSRIWPLQLTNIGFLPRTSNSTLPAFQYIAPTNQLATSSAADFPLIELNSATAYPTFLHRRPRGEKRPIPDEQKDDKYYERRKRNNEAAKKSRDARKLREDRIAFRAALLEQENSMLRAQVISLRDELQAMRQLMTTTSTVLQGKYVGN